MATVDWRSLDLTQAIAPEENEFLRDVQERAGARLAAFSPLTVAERFEAFAWMGFKPHGLFLPFNEKIAGDLRRRVRLIGDIQDIDPRLEAYYALQSETEQMYLEGVEGRWNGQQAWARSEAKFRQVAVSRRGGKGLSLDTPIPTPMGWTTMGDIRVGDTVFDEAGAPTRVTFVSDVHHLPCYEVTFSDGSKVVCDDEHLWQVDTKASRLGGKVRYPRGKPWIVPPKPQSVVTAGEMMGSLKTKDGRESQYSVRLAGPIQCPEQMLPIDPYVLGVWLGDGDSHSGAYTKNDPEIAEEISARGYAVYPVKVPDGKASHWRVVGLTTLLGKVGLLNNKHVPEIYLRASVEQRLDLLRGMMDTDGYCAADGQVEFSSSRMNLSESAQELMESLGQRTTFTERRAVLYGKDCGPSYRVLCRPTIPMFTLPRKLDRQKSKAPAFPHRYVVTIEPVPSVPTQCIAVESPSHLYLIDHFIPTHNTLYAACEAIATVKMKPRCRVWVASSTMHAVSRCFDMILQKVRDLDMRIVEKRNSRDEKWLVVESGSIVEGVTLDERATEVGAAVDLAILDEAFTVSRESWLHTVLPPLADRNGRVLMISSYHGQENFFYERTQDEDAEDWELFEDTSWDVNFYAFPQGRQSASIMTAERESSDDMSSFLEEYGNVPTGTRRAIYPQYRDRVHAGVYPYVPGVPVLLGVDPSSGANEYAVGAVQEHGEDWWVIDEFYRQGALAEDAMNWADHRPWRHDFKEGVCDSQAQSDIKRWRDGGYDIIGVEKPMVDQRIPVYRKRLRDPRRFYPIFLQLAREVLDERGDDRDYDELTPKELSLVYMEIEALLSPTRLSPQRIEALIECSHIFVNSATCPNTMHEHKTYAYRKPTRSLNTIPEAPRKYKDHMMDLLGYLAWHYKRFDVARGDRLLSYSYIRVAGKPDIEELEEERSIIEQQIAEAAEEIGATQHEPIWGKNGVETWLQIQRRLNRSAGASSSFSILETTRR